jgi:hypothetical protein
MIIRFPVCMRVDGHHWFGGRVFKSTEEVVASLTDVEQRRVNQWLALNADSIGKPTSPNALHHGGGNAA